MNRYVARALSAVGLVTTAQLEERVRAVQMRRPLGSGVPFGWDRFDYEKTDEMAGTKRWDTLDRMENDPHVKGALRLNTLPLLNAEWSIQPASDKPKDVEVAEFVAANLLRKSSDRYGADYWVQTAWPQRLNEILQFLRDGFAMFALSYRRVGSKIVYDRIQWLEPSSVDPQGWVLDATDNIVEVKRSYKNPRNEWKLWEKLPADAIALYVWDLKGARYEGRPLIRSMYGPWKRKNQIQLSAMMWALKVGAPLPVAHYIATNMSDATLADIETFVKALRGEEPSAGWGMFPKNSDGSKAVEFEYVGSEANVERGMQLLVSGENAEIAHAGATKTDQLGETQTGSRAVASVMSRREMEQVEAIAKIVGQFECHGVANIVGLIERLVRMNFAGVTEYPQLVASKIDPHEGLDQIPNIVSAKGAGLVPSHPELRKQVTERFGFNLPEEAYEQEPMLPGAEQGKPGEEKQPGGMGERMDDEDEGEEQSYEMRLAAREEFRRRIAPLLAPVEGAPVLGAGFRAPNRLELEVCQLGEVAEAFRVGERDVMLDLRAIGDDMIEDLMGRLRAGKVTTRNLDGLRRSKFRRYDKAVSRVQSSLLDAGRSGAKQVDDEIRRAR